MQCSSCKSEFYCGQEHQKQRWQEHKGDCQKWKPFKEQIVAARVKLGQSLIPQAGRGLFAKEDLKMGEQVAIYFGEYAPEGELSFTAKEVSFNYRMEDGRLLKGSKSSKVPAFLSGQFINDPYMEGAWIDILMNLDCRKPNLEDLRLVMDGYLQNHFLPHSVRQNVDLIDNSPYPYFRANRKIQRGEELYWPYGVNYWMSIPEKICMRKGFPEVSLDIKNVMMDSVSALPQSQKQLKALYMPSVDMANLDKDREILVSSENRIPLQIASILGGHDIIQMHILDKARFSNFFKSLNGDAILEGIADSRELYHFDRGYLIHPKGKQLALDLIDLQNQSDYPVFRWIDVKKQSYVPMEEMEKLLSKPESFQ